MEQQLVHFGTVLLKFWLHIDPMHNCGALGSGRKTR
jgi:polyphosphate kinase 2 (PPK2 family)